MDEIRFIRGKASGDQYSDWLDSGASLPVELHPENVLDSVETRELLSKLLAWFYLEREKQSANRFEMAMDHAFYDNEQWSPEDAATLRERGQMPLVFNEIGPMIDWLIGTERRSRVDWRVLPRTEDDVQMADIKTKVMKYVSDINRITYLRSRAFADAVKGGVGWIDDGVRDDPTQDPLYCKYEDWRNVLWDSSSYELDLSDARYLFRWRWVDEDIALMMFPERAAQIKQACEDSGAYSAQEEEDSWYMGESLNNESNKAIMATGSGMMIDAQRRRVKLIECQYRHPCKCQVVADGPMKGAFFNPADNAMMQIVAADRSTIIDRIMMRVHFAVFTEAHMLSMGPSIYRHNRFSLTPVWCYRRSRDRLPYGAIRRVRDVQQDLNKRASKALHLLNTNQIIADEGATDDWNLLREEANTPDGVIIKKPGKDLQIRRDTEGATGQIQMMTLDAQSIQKSAGVSQENMGRQTNAVSGEAIKARQLQGSVVTTEPFDNLRYATQVSGEKQLSLIEQFYTQEKVIRLTGTKGKFEWVRINQPEQQPDGSIRWINDITSAKADFMVSEQDYAGSLRAVMFDSLNQMAGRLQPEISLRLLTIAMEFSDMPNKDEIAEAIRKLTGERDPDKEMSPEELQQAEQNMQMQSESMRMQREQAMLAIEEQRARVREINAKAQELESRAAGQGGVPVEIEQSIRKVQAQAADQIDRLTQELAKAQTELANRTLQISSESNVKLAVANIEADAKIRVAEIQDNTNRQIAALEKKMEALMQQYRKPGENQSINEPERAQGGLQKEYQGGN